MIQPEPSDGAAGGPALVVEDDDDVRDTLREMVQEGLGVPCDAVPDAEAAFRLIDRRRYGLLVVDERLPGPRGSDIIACARARNPELLCVLTSGDRDAGEVARRANVQLFLQKPFDPREAVPLLRRLVASALR